MKSSNVLVAFFRIIFEEIKKEFTLTSSRAGSNKERPILVTEQEVKSEIERVFFSGDYYPFKNSTLIPHLKIKYDGLIEFVVENNKDNNLYQFASFVREAIMLKYLLSKGLVFEIDDVGSSLEEIMPIVDLKASIYQEEIVQYLRGEFTPVFKRLFDSMKHRPYAYEESEDDSYDDVLYEIKEDFIQAYFLWCDGLTEEQWQTEEAFYDKDLSEYQAAEMLKNDDDFMQDFARLCAKTPVNEDNVYDESLDRNIQPLIEAFFKNQGINYSSEELEIIWAQLSSEISTWERVTAIIERISTPRVTSHAIKIYEEDASRDGIDFAIKVVVYNPSNNESLWVDIQGLDKDGFEVLGLSLPAEVELNSEAAVSERFGHCSRREFHSVTEWKFNVS